MFRFILFNLLMCFAYSPGFSKDGLLIIDGPVGEHRILSNLKIFFDHAHSFDPDNVNFALLDPKLSHTTSQFGKLGYGPARVWIRLSVKSSMPEELELFLKYGYVSMQKISFYLTDSSRNLILRYKSGKSYKFESRPVLHKDYVFPFKLESHKHYNIYLMMESVGSFQVPITIETNASLRTQSFREYLGLGLYYGFILLTLIYSSIIYFSVKRADYLFYAIYITFACLTEMSLHGISYQYLWPNFVHWNMYSTFFFVGLTLFSLILFTASFFNTKALYTKYHNILRGYAFTALLVTLVSPFAYGSLLIKLTGFLVAIMPIIFLPLSIKSLSDGNRSAIYYLFGVVFYVIGASLYGLKDTGILSPNFLTENGIIIGGAIEMFIFSLGLGFKFREIEIKAQKLEIETQRTSAVKEIVRQVAHDIRSPLSALNALAASLSEESKDKSELLKKVVSRINGIAQDLLAEGKKSLAGNPYNAKSTNMVTFQDLISELDQIIKEKGLETENSIRIIRSYAQRRAPNHKVEINCMELKRVLSNILNNSCEAISGNLTGEIRVDLEPLNSNLYIRVGDNGCGISNEVLQKLGRKPVTTKPESKTSGNGLGVFHAKKTVESWGGQLKISSAVGRGTTFEIELPILGTA